MLIVTLSVLWVAGVVALFGLWELRRKRVERLMALVADRTAAEYTKQLRP